MLVPIIKIVITDFDKNITVFLGQSTIGPRCERENILAVDIRGLGHNSLLANHIILKKKGNLVHRITTMMTMVMMMMMMMMMKGQIGEVGCRRLYHCG